MNSEQLRGQWDQLMGEARKQWGKLTDDDVQQVKGDREKLVGRVKERYGYEKEDAEREVDQWMKRH